MVEPTNKTDRRNYCIAPRNFASLTAKKAAAVAQITQEAQERQK